MIGVALVATMASGVIEIFMVGGKGVLLFVVSAVALAVLAALVGEGTDQLGLASGTGCNWCAPVEHWAIYRSSSSRSLPYVPGCLKWFRQR